MPGHGVDHAATAATRRDVTRDRQPVPHLKGDRTPSPTARSRAPGPHRRAMAVTLSKGILLWWRLLRSAGRTGTQNPRHPERERRPSWSPDRSAPLGRASWSQTLSLKRSEGWRPSKATTFEPMRIDRNRFRPDRGVDPIAFVALYDKHSEALLRFFARRTLDPEVAFDLTTETFAQAFLTRSRFDERRGTQSAWLYGIARHQLGTYLRRLRVERNARVRLGLDGQALADDDYERVEALIDFAEVGRHLRVALQDLPSDQREAVVYRVIDELSYEQIAERVGCSQEAARARVSRGLRLLARTLAPPNDVPELGEPS
jgi:RNA polymerase sigma factor (sigma-70 family)